MGVAAATVVLRLFTRFHVSRANLNVDDCLVVIALAFSTALIGIVFKQIEHGLAYHMWDIPFETYNIWNPLYTIVATILYALRIVVCYSVVYVLINIFGCKPIEAGWDTTIPKAQASCVDKLTTYLTLSIANIIMDVLILLLPLPVVIPLQMGKRQKFSLILLFGTGAFVCGVATKRTVDLPGLLSSPDYCWDAVTQFVWCFLEVNAGIVCASVPALKPFFMRYLPSIIASRMSSKGGGVSSTGKSGRSRDLNTVVAENIERRRMQDEGYELSSHDGPRVPVEDDDEAKLWNGYQKSIRTVMRRHTRASSRQDLESSSLDTLDEIGGPKSGDRKVVVSSASYGECSDNEANGIMVRRETTVLEQQKKA
ncbi:integral membrane protein [Colletotrichum plurivorum]|uniref:Integral membrane protein n=1 Tax=Colletotrichum plurivorum TaxID=2175906 RepID=A0A8H6U6H0_9PEZI|nr:integral membrane protein [Colletotrichum plurivorum]